MDPALRELVRDRAAARCEYCHLSQQFSELRFHVEHVMPRQHGGSDNAENLALACPDCNLLKGPNLTGVDPTTQRVVRLFHPRRDKWAEHFVQVGPRIFGRTPPGRATVSLLKLNDPQRLEVRALILGL
jgi:5-methylcytosine-specific restriction endonuclease McrA